MLKGDLMRPWTVLAALAVVPAFATAGDRNEGADAIKVVALERKDPVTFEKDVEPILTNKCAFCHSGNLKEGKLDMGSYETLIKGGKRGPSVVPGKSADSLLVRLAGKTVKPFMPPKREEPLTPQELALLKLWIDQGARAPTTVRERPRVVLSAPPAGVHPVLGVAVSPDKSAVAASRGNQVHVYDAGAGAYVRSLTDPKLTTPDGKPLRAANLSLVESLAWSADGKYLATGSYQEVVLWDARTGVLRRRLTGFADRVVALAFSHDGKLLATGGGPATGDGEVKVFEVVTGKQVLDLKNAHSDTVFAVAFSPDGKMLATGSADKFVKTFAIPSGKFLKQFEGHTHHVLGVGWKADGKLLASAGADNVVKVWEFDKGEQVRTIPGHGKQITSLAFLGNTPQFATCSGDQTVRFWNVDNGGNTRNFSAGGDFLYAVGVSPDGAVVAAGGQEGVVHLYNGNTGAPIKDLLPPGAAPAVKK
jgi:WD40 repeat protein